MKKIFLCFAAVISLLSMVSCEDDEIAQTLDGIWEGEVATEYFTHRGYTTAYQYVDIQFYADPYRYAKGTGVEYDYQTSRYYTTCGFSFSVENGRIYLDYEDGSHVVIYRYSLNNNHFTGDFIDYRTGDFLASFDFYKVDNWRYNRYSGYSGYYRTMKNGKLEVKEINK